MVERDELYAHVAEGIAPLKRPLVVGVNGAYTAGKTIFADGLQQQLRARGINTQLIHYDDFHNPFSVIEWTADTEVDAFYHRAFDPQKLIREVFLPLKEQGYVDRRIACINLNTGAYTNTIHVEIDENTIILLEGVLLFRPPLIDYIDYKIYFHIDDEQMLKRARQRDVPRFGEAIYQAFQTRYIPVQHRYVAEYNPMGMADLVIDNNDYQRPCII